MKPIGPRSSRVCRILGRTVLALIALYVLLLIPASDPVVTKPAKSGSFAWNQDEFWSALEAQFKEARSQGCERLASRIDSSFSGFAQSLNEIAAKRLAPEDPRFDLLETNLFRLAPLIGACPNRLPDFIQLATRMREVVKEQ